MDAFPRQPSNGRPGARARRQRRDARVAHAALSRARRSVPTAAAYLRAEAQGYRAEANVFAGGDGGLGAWRAAERREARRTHLERLCEATVDALQSS